MAVPNTVFLAGQPFLPQEKTASEAITPGHLVEFVPTGGSAGQLRKHATAGGQATCMFALEVPTPDRRATTVPIDTPYQTGETVHWVMAQKCELLALVPASASAIVTGDALVSNGDGTLRKQGTGTEIVVAIAAEPVNNSAGGTPARIRIYGR
jgi:hypothetical protein